MTYICKFGQKVISVTHFQGFSDFLNTKTIKVQLKPIYYKELSLQFSKKKKDGLEIFAKAEKIHRI